MQLCVHERVNLARIFKVIESYFLQQSQNPSDLRGNLKLYFFNIFVRSRLRRKCWLTNCLDHSKRLRKIWCFDQGSGFGQLSAKRDNHVLNEKEFSTNSADSHPISVWYRSTSTLISCPSMNIVLLSHKILIP